MISSTLTLRTPPGSTSPPRDHHITRLPRSCDTAVEITNAASLIQTAEDVANLDNDLSDSTDTPDSETVSSAGSLATTSNDISVDSGSRFESFPTDSWEIKSAPDRSHDYLKSCVHRNRDMDRRNPLNTLQQGRNTAQATPERRHHEENEPLQPALDPTRLVGGWAAGPLQGLHMSKPAESLPATKPLENKPLQPALDLTRLVGVWAAGPLQGLHMSKPAESLLATQPLENEAAGFREESVPATAPMISQLVKRSNTSPKSSLRCDATSLATQDTGSVEDLLSLQNNANVIMAVGSQERRVPQSTSREPDKARSTKRSHHAAFPDAANAELAEGGSSAVRQRTQNGDDARTRFLACPFYKKDRHKYLACLSYQLRRIKDVKQHINRRHNKPDFYCSRCFKIFDTADSRDAHTRLANCEIQADPQYDGISTQQKRVLAQYVSRCKSIEEQWYDMWDTIFQGERRPKSVYVGTYLEEMMPLLRTFWDKRQSEIISSVVQTSQLEPLARQVANAVMGSVFDRFEEAMSGLAPEQPEEVTRKGREVQRVITPAVSRTGTFQEGILDETGAPAYLHTMLPATVSSHFLDCGAAFSMAQNGGSPQLYVINQFYNSFSNDPQGSLGQFNTLGGENWWANP